LGWSTATMLYDLSNGAPEPGSLLESVCLLIAKKRREADFFRTKLLVEATLAPHAKDSSGLSKSFEAYRESMFPFLGTEFKKDDEQSKKLLNHWVGKKAFRIKPLWRASDTRGIRSRLKRGAERVKHLEESRKLTRHRRI